MATAYFIADMMGEGQKEIDEMWETLRRVDVGLRQKFTLFLSVSSFAPSPFTPLERAEIHPWMDFAAMYERNRPRYDKLVIAKRGGLIAAPQRIAQMLVTRGKENSRLAVHWLATKGWPLLRSTNNADAATVVAVLKKAGVEAVSLYGEFASGDALPWHNIQHPLVAA
jgi:hypothetical protein